MLTALLRGASRRVSRLKKASSYLVAALLGLSGLCDLLVDHFQILPSDSTRVPPQSVFPITSGQSLSSLGGLRVNSSAKKNSLLVSENVGFRVIV